MSNIYIIRGDNMDKIECNSMLRDIDTIRLEINDLLIKDTREVDFETKVSSLLENFYEKYKILINKDKKKYVNKNNEKSLRLS